MERLFTSYSIPRRGDCRNACFVPSLHLVHKIAQHTTLDRRTPQIQDFALAWQPPHLKLHMEGEKADLSLSVSEADSRSSLSLASQIPIGGSRCGCWYSVLAGKLQTRMTQLSSVVYSINLELPYRIVLRDAIDRDNRSTRSRNLEEVCLMYVQITILGRQVLAQARSPSGIEKGEG